MTTRAYLVTGALWCVTLAGALHFLPSDNADQTPSGFPKRHPEEIQVVYDMDYRAYRAVLPGGAQEMICESGVRRRLRVHSKLIIQSATAKYLRQAETLSSIPAAAFPVVCTFDHPDDPSHLIFSLASGEVFAEWQPCVAESASPERGPPDL